MIEWLQTIQSQGYAVSSQEHSLDVASVAAPVYGPEGLVVALAISGPAFRLPTQALHKLSEPLRVVAQHITSSVGGVSVLP